MEGNDWKTREFKVFTEKWHDTSNCRLLINYSAIIGSRMEEIAAENMFVLHAGCFFSPTKLDILSISISYPYHDIHIQVYPVYP
jgi:hypothetical protein